MQRFLLSVAFVSLMAVPALARDCSPVETAPGVASLPRGCRALDKARPPAADASRGKARAMRFGDTEVHVSGSVTIEAGTGRSR